MLIRRIRTLGLVVAASSLPLMSHAALTADTALKEFNLIVLGDAQSSSHVDGRTFIGGSLNGGDYVQHVTQTPISTFSGLTVLGDATRINVNGLGVYVRGDLSQANINSGAARVVGNASNTNFNGSAAAAVGGNAVGINFNSGQLTGLAKTNALSSATSIADSQNFGALFTQTSNTIRGLADTGGTVAISGNRVTFNALANNGLAVFDLSSIDDTVFSKGEFAFNLNGATTVIFNSDNLSINLAANFLGGSAVTYGQNFLWNFYNASNVTLSNQFGGSLLAAQARLTNFNNIEGSVVVSSLDQRGEIHLQPFAGHMPVTPVPEPSTYAMLLSGLFLLVRGVKRSQRLHLQ